MQPKSRILTSHQITNIETVERGDIVLINFKDKEYIAHIQLVCNNKVYTEYGWFDTSQILYVLRITKQ